MNKNLKIVGYGVLVWLIPTLISILILLLSAINLFETIAPIAITITVVMFSYLYLKDIDTNFIKEGVVIGLSWAIISIVLDLLMIMIGVTQLSLTSYTVYVGPLYLVVPALTIGFGYLLDSKLEGSKRQI